MLTQKGVAWKIPNVNCHGLLSSILSPKKFIYTSGEISMINTNVYTTIDFFVTFKVGFTSCSTARGYNNASELYALNAKGICINKVIL